MTICHTGCKWTSSMTGRHLWWRVVRFKSNRVDLTTSTTPFTDTYGIFSKGVSVWYDGRSIRVESIRQHLQPPIADTCGIFSKSLTNWLPVCVSMFWEMVSQNSGITTPLSRESISGLTIRSGLGVLDNPPQLINDLEIFILLLWICSFCLCQSLKL